MSDVPDPHGGRCPRRGGSGRAAVVADAARRRTSVPSAAKGLTAVEGLRVGQHTLSERPTGCTVVVVDGDGAVGGVSQRGGAPGTVETNLLDPANAVDTVNASCSPAEAPTASTSVRAW